MKSKKLKNKLVFTLSFFIIFSLLIGGSVSAYITYNNKKLIGGVSNLTYFFDYMVSSEYQENISYGIDSWRYSSMNDYINFREVTNSSAQIIFREENTNSGELGAYGGVVMHLNAAGTVIDARTANWTKAKVIINRYYCGSNSSITEEVAAHELGHAMGLMHIGRTDLLMYYDYYNRTVSTPQQDEFNGIAYLYG